jgi:hypothetical protein
VAVNVLVVLPMRIRSPARIGRPVRTSALPRAALQAGHAGVSTRTAAPVIPSSPVSRPSTRSAAGW